MTAVELLRLLKERRIQISASGEALGYRAPKGAMTPALRQLLDKHRSELLALLAGHAASGSVPKEPGADYGLESKKALMALRSQGYVPICSSTLDGEIVLFLRDESVSLPERWNQAVTYTMAELQQILGMTTESLRRIHEVKREMGGRIER